MVELLSSMGGVSYAGHFSFEEREGMLQKEEEEENERVAAGELKFVASRQGLPSKSAHVPVIDWMGESWSRVMKEPTKRLLDPSPVGPCPRRFHAAPPKEWEEFVGRKAASGMVAAVGLKHVPEGPQGEQLWSGVFPVPKSKDEDRCIDDRRPMNWRERKWVGRKPSHGVHYCRGILRPGRRKKYSVLDAPPTSIIT